MKVTLPLINHGVAAYFLSVVHLFSFHLLDLAQGRVRRRWISELFHS